jgi:hypothetical protein
MRKRGKNEKVKNLKWGDLKGNEKFQKRKCAYFLTKVRGKGFSKHIFFFLNYPLRGRFLRTKNPNILIPEKNVFKYI